MALWRPKMKRPVGVWNAGEFRMREILLSLLPNTVEYRMIRSWRPAMTSMLYHQGNRAFQDEFGSRRLADRLEERSRTAFTDDDKVFIESCLYFFMATADASGHPDCSFKGGAPGFVRVTGPSELAFPDYDGNGMFKSIGNLAINPHVGLLFIAMHGTPKRLRINGNARIDRDDPLLPDTVGAQLIVRIKVDVIFPNCPRYIPSMTLTEPSCSASGCRSRRAGMEGIRRVQGCRAATRGVTRQLVCRGASAARENRTVRTPVIPTPKEIAWLPFPYF